MGLTTAASVDPDVSATQIFVTPPTTMAPALTEPETQRNRLSDQTTGAAPVQSTGDQQSSIASFQTSFLNSPILTNNNNRQNTLRGGLKGKISPSKPYLASDGPKFGPSHDHIQMDAKQDLSSSASVNLTGDESTLPTTSHITSLQTSEEERKEIANSIMGLQKDFLKPATTQDVEQMLGELASGEIDLLQVFKSLEEQAEAVPTGDGGLCDLGSGLSFFNDDVMNMCEDVVQSTPPNKDAETQEIQAEIEKRQAQMQRKVDFLLRRLRKMQARTMGQHISEEIAGMFEHSQRHLKKKDKEFNQQQKQVTTGLVAPTVASASPTTVAISDIIPYQPPPPPISAEKLRPLSALAIRNFLRRVETTATYQHQNATKRLQSNKFFSTLHQSQQAGVPSTPKSHSAMALIPKYDDVTVDQMDQVSGMLHTEMSLIESSIDSEATESSSGGESADEMVSYTNLEQQSLSIANRAAWRWARDRGAIASRWSWLLAQISDLEYRIRQHNELYNQIKKNKGSVTFEDAVATPADDIPNQPSHQSVNGYRGVLPGSSKLTSGNEIADPNGAFDPNASIGTSRTRPFQRAGFRKRKLMQTANLHTISKKAAKSSTVKCGCQWPMHPCALCTGRTDPTSPRDLPDTMPASERIALLDPCYHPVLSLPEDVSHSIHFEAIMRVTEWQNKVVRCTAKSAMKQALLLGTTKAERTLSSKHGDIDDDLALQNFPIPKKYNVDGKRKYKKYKTHGLTSKLKKAKTRRGLHHVTTTTTNYSKTNHNNHKQRKLFGQTQNSAASATVTSGAVAIRDGKTAGDYGTAGVSLLNNSHNNSNNGWISGSGHVNNIPRSKNSSPTSFSYKNESRICSDLRRSRNSYDIDNIVIPYSMAAATRVEILPYKEIITPKWRIVNDDEETTPTPKIKVINNGSRPSSQPAIIPSQFNSEEFEDISDEVMQQKHERALLEERKKFQSFLKFPYSSRSRANRRIDSRAESSGTNTPDQPPSPAAGLITPLNTTNDQESIPSPFASLPQTPLDGQELTENSVAQALAQTATTLLEKRERRRTTSSKFKSELSREEIFRSFTPEIKEIIQPFEPLQFPLSDDMYDEMLQEMPENHLTLVDELLTEPSLETSAANVSVNSSATTGNATLFEDTRADSYLVESWTKSSKSTGSQSILFSPRKQTKNRLEKILNDEDDDDDTSTRSIDSETESISDLPDGIDDYDDPDDPEYRVPLKHARV